MRRACRAGGHTLARHLLNSRSWRATQVAHSAFFPPPSAGGKNLTPLMFNGVGDGTQQSGMLILVSLLNTISAILNGYTSDELNAVFDQLGLFDPSEKVES